MRDSLLLVAVFAASGSFQPMRAQNSLPSPGLHIAVHASYVGRTGDTVSIGYTVLVSSASTDSLSNFVVDAPSRVSVVPPDRIFGWRPGNLFHGRPVASWAGPGHLIPPGDSTARLVMRATGLTDIKRYWADGGLHMSKEITDRADTPSGDTTVTLLGPSGWTVSASPLPADLSSAALLTRLNRLIRRSCELGWISDAATCTGLYANAVASADSLRALIADLNAKRGKQVGEPAYALLMDNAQFVLGRL